MKKIIPCLWYDKSAEEAVNYYLSVFPNSKIISVNRYDKASAEVAGMPEGSVLTIYFSLNGHEFCALNGGPVFKFNEAVSFVVNVETQEELDKYWSALSAVPASEQCGWCKDKWGLSWQITPTMLYKLLESDTKKASAAMRAMLEMKKLDIAKLQEAYDNA
jgi:predicted 3-demethylubiquinone-9 3-methyltransferase (glyoxalase superfamily)